MVRLSKLRMIFFIILLGLPQLSMAKSLDYFVLGVITSSQGSQGVALLKEKSSGKIKAHKEGQAVTDKLQVKEIHRKFVLFSQDKNVFKVMVGTDDPLDYKVKKVAPPVSISKGLDKSEGELRIQSALKEKLVNEDLSKVLMQAATEPFIQDGSILGFKIWDIEPESIYEKAGFKNGDLITHINGNPLTDAGNAIKTLRSLRDSTDVNITYQTRGQEKNLRILVQ